MRINICVLVCYILDVYLLDIQGEMLSRLLAIMSLEFKGTIRAKEMNLSNIGVQKDIFFSDICHFVSCPLLQC